MLWPTARTRRSPCRLSDRVHVVGGGAAQNFLYHPRQNPSRCFERCEQHRTGTMNPRPSTSNDINANRARIGYNCQLLRAQVFPYEFNHRVTPHDTPVTTTLPSTMEYTTLCQ